MSKSQLKSKERVRDFGEVFTAEREVKAMCDLVKPVINEIDSTVLEPACGDGNFLVEILARKLKTAYRIAGKNDADFEYFATRTFCSVYGVDIQEDNIDDARKRMFDNFFAFYVRRYNHKPSRICLDSIDFILTQNIQCGNTLTGKDADDNDLIITKWFFDKNNGLTISLFRFMDLVENGCYCEPAETLPTIPYFMLPAIRKKDKEGK